MTFIGYVGFLDNASSDSVSASVTDTPPAPPFTPGANGIFLINADVDSYIATNEEATAEATPLWSKTPLLVKLRGPAQDYAGDALSYGRQGGTIWITKVLP